MFHFSHHNVFRELSLFMRYWVRTHYLDIYFSVFVKCFFFFNLSNLKYVYRIAVCWHLCWTTCSHTPRTQRIRTPLPLHAFSWLASLQLEQALMLRQPWSTRSRLLWVEHWAWQKAQRSMPGESSCLVAILKLNFKQLRYLERTWICKTWLNFEFSLFTDCKQWCVSSAPLWSRVPPPQASTAQPQPRPSTTAWTISSDSFWRKALSMTLPVCLIALIYPGITIVVVIIMIINNWY